MKQKIDNMIWSMDWQRENSDRLRSNFKEKLHVPTFQNTDMNYTKNKIEGNRMFIQEEVGEASLEE